MWARRVTAENTIQQRSPEQSVPGRADHHAVIFDLDGLLVDSEPLYMAAWQGAAFELGFELTDETYYSLIGLPEVECEPIVMEHFGADFPLADFRDRWKQLWSERFDAGELRAKPGAVELLGALDEAKVPVALATSSKRDYATISLRSANLDPYFDHIVTTDDVTRGKPAPDLFLLAASRLGVQPPRCLVLEDSPTGAEAGLSAGMSLVLIPDLCTPPQTYVERAFLVAGSLTEALPRILDALHRAEPAS